jgi:hypothetical protein
VGGGGRGGRGGGRERGELEGEGEVRVRRDWVVFAVVVVGGRSERPYNQGGRGRVRMTLAGRPGATRQSEVSLSLSARQRVHHSQAQPGLSANQGLTNTTT